MLNVIDEFTHECLAIRGCAAAEGDRCDRRAVRSLHPARRAGADSSLTMGPSLSPKPCRSGLAGSAPRRPISRRAHPGRTAMSRASTPGSGTSCWTAKSSTRSGRRRSSSRVGGGITMRCGRTNLSYRPPTNMTCIISGSTVLHQKAPAPILSSHPIFWIVSESRDKCCLPAATLSLILIKN